MLAVALLRLPAAAVPVFSANIFSLHPEESLHLGDPILTGGEGSLTQWVHCEFVVSFEAIRPVITSRYVVSSFKKYPPKYPLGTF